MSKTKRRRYPKEAEPPLWLRTTTGTAMQICATCQRCPDGFKLYRLRGLEYNVLGKNLYTVATMRSMGYRFLKLKPRAYNARATTGDRSGSR